MEQLQNKRREVSAVLGYVIGLIAGVAVGVIIMSIFKGGNGKDDK